MTQETNNKWKCGCSKEKYQKLLAEAEDWEVKKKEKLREILDSDKAPYWYCNGKEGEEHYLTNYPQPWGSFGTTYSCCHACGKKIKKITEFGDEKQLDCVCSKNNNNSIERERESILNYFKQHNIKSAKLEGDKLIIEYNSSQTETKEIDDQELEQIKSYSQKIGKSELSLSDLEQVSNNQSNSPEKSNKTLYIGLAVVGILVIGIIAYFLLRNKKEK